jgi:hypothetical protein
MASFAAIFAIGKPVAFDAELDVAPAGVDADAADDVDADVPHVLVLAVGQRQCGGDGDRVTRVHAHRVDVLDRADDDRVVRVVAHELELVLLPAQDRLLEQDLGRRARLQPVADEADEVCFGVREARAQAAHGERRADDERVPEVLRELLRLLQGVRDVAAGDVGAGL